MSEEVLAAVREVEERIWISWVLIHMRLLSRNTDAPRCYKICWREGNWLCTSNNVEIKQPVMGHTESDRSAFEEFLDTAAITLQIVPLFRFASVFTRILPSCVGSIVRTKWCYVR